MSRLRNRLARLELVAPKPRMDTPEARRAYWRENGLPEDSVVLGLGESMIIVQPPVDEPAY